MSFWTDVANVLTLGAYSDAQGAVHAVGDVAGVFGAFFNEITNVYFWRSVGWLVLGLLMGGIGLFILLKKPLGQAANAVGKVGELAAVAAV